MRTAASRQSARDWSGFLQSRSSEVRDGGKLLCLVIISTGRPVNSDLLGTHLWASILDVGREGKLTEAEQLHITVPISYGLMTELRAPFGSEDQYAGLHLHHLGAPQHKTRSGTPSNRPETQRRSAPRGRTPCEPSPPRRFSVPSARTVPSSCRRPPETALGARLRPNGQHRAAASAHSSTVPCRITGQLASRHPRPCQFGCTTVVPNLVESRGRAHQLRTHINAVPLRRHLSVSQEG